MKTKYPKIISYNNECYVWHITLTDIKYKFSILYGVKIIYQSNNQYDDYKFAGNGKSIFFYQNN